MIEVCTVNDFLEKQSLGFQHRGIHFFIVKFNKHFFGYVNECPHLGTTLEFQKDQFLDADKRFIQCSMHGALFNYEDGECVHGPCVGEYLKPVPLVIQEDRIFADI